MIYVLFALHSLVGVGAVMGGCAAIINPYTPLGVSVEVLKNSPFSSFLIPGIILFTVLGFRNLFGAVAILRRSRLTGCISGVMGCVLVIWIIVQCIMLNAIHVLHVIFFAIGVMQVILVTILMFVKRLFPVNIILDTFNELRKDTI